MLSWHSALGALRNTAINPLLLFAVIILVAAADFASMAVTGRGELAQNNVSTTASVLVGLEVKYVCLLVAALCGIGVAFFLATAGKPSERRVATADIRLFTVTLYLGVLAGWVISLLNLGVDVTSLADTVAVKLESTTAVSLFIFSMLLLPGLTYALAKMPLRVALPLVVISIVVLLSSGSRTRIIYVLIPFAFYLIRVRGIPISRRYFAVGVALLAFLSIVGVNYRTAVAYGKDMTLKDLSSVSNVLNSNDIAFVESNLALSFVRPDRLEKYFGEDLLGFALAPIPRSIATLKPYPGSIEFTRAYDPFKYSRFRRGLTIGGINEIEYDYPFPVAIAVIFLLAAGWGWAFVRASSSRSLSGFAWTVGLYVMLYVFLKVDLESTGQIAWSFGLYWLLVEPYRRLKASISPKPLATPRGPRPPWNRQTMPQSAPNVPAG